MHALSALFLCFLALLTRPASSQKETDSQLQFEDTCGSFDKIPKDGIKLPESFAHFREPWMRHANSKLFESRVFDRNWQKIFKRKVQGLNDTVQGVFDWLSSSNCLFFAWGGSVRDAVTGFPPTDIDAAVTCNPHYLKRICITKYGRKSCNRPHIGSFKLTIGGEPDERDNEFSVEPLDFAHWNTSFEVNPSRLEYSPNTLAVMFESRSDSLHAVLIDIFGFSLHDVCTRIIRIPARQEFWNEWAHERDINKVYRYWKLRSSGYFAWEVEERAFLVDIVRSSFTEQSFFRFVCHYQLSGTVLQTEDNGNSLFCSRPLAKDDRLAKLIIVLKADFGVKYYQRTFAPVINKIIEQKSIQ